MYASGFKINKFRSGSKLEIRHFRCIYSILCLELTWEKQSSVCVNFKCWFRVFSVCLSVSPTLSPIWSASQTFEIKSKIADNSICLPLFRWSTFHIIQEELNKCRHHDWNCVMCFKLIPTCLLVLIGYVVFFNAYLLGNRPSFPHCDFNIGKVSKCHPEWNSHKQIECIEWLQTMISFIQLQWRLWNWGMKMWRIGRAIALIQWMEKVNRQSIFPQLFNLCDIKHQQNRKSTDFHDIHWKYNTNRTNNTCHAIPSAHTFAHTIRWRYFWEWGRGWWGGGWIWFCII